MKTLFSSLMLAAIFLSACNHSGKSSNNAAVTVNSPATDGAATTANTANLPVMTFEKEAYDFGKIKSGDKVTFDFKFKNTGKSPLIITDGFATCGCTKPQWPKTPVQPGESGVINVTFDSAGKTGLQDKMITITANTNPAQSRVHLIGEVTDTKK